MALILYNKIMSFNELLKRIEPLRGEDGIARKVLMHRCTITECPPNTSPLSLADMLGIDQSIARRCIFTADIFPLNR